MTEWPLFLRSCKPLFLVSLNVVEKDVIPYKECLLIFSIRKENHYVLEQQLLKNSECFITKSELNINLL